MSPDGIIGVVLVLGGRFDVAHEQGYSALPLRSGLRHLLQQSLAPCDVDLFCEHILRSLCD